MIGRIYGTGSYIPTKVVTNHDIAKNVDTSDEWIRAYRNCDKIYC